MRKSIKTLLKKFKREYPESLTSREVDYWSAEEAEDKVNRFVIKNLPKKLQDEGAENLWSYIAGVR